MSCAEMHKFHHISRMGENISKTELCHMCQDLEVTLYYLSFGLSFDLLHVYYFIINMRYKRDIQKSADPKYTLLHTYQFFCMFRKKLSTSTGLLQNSAVLTKFVDLCVFEFLVPRYQKLQQFSMEKYNSCPILLSRQRKTIAKWNFEHKVLK